MGIRSVIEEGENLEKEIELIELQLIQKKQRFLDLKDMAYSYWKGFLRTPEGKKLFKKDD